MSSKKPSSPYKAVKSRNSSYIGFMSMSLMKIDKPYKIVEIKHTYHDKYKDGELVTIVGENKQKHKVQLPVKYLKMMSEEQIGQIYKDIENKKFPFLVYRGTLPDKSFDMDLLENKKENEASFAGWKSVPRLDGSLTESETSMNSSKPDEEKDNVEREMANPDKEAEGPRKKRSKFE